jgi:hypothetical protein
MATPIHAVFLKNEGLNIQKFKIFLLFCLIYMHIDRGSFLSITFCFILYMIQYAFSCPFFDVDKGGEIFPT